MFFLSVFNWAEKDAEKGLELENLDIAEAPEDDDDNGDPRLRTGEVMLIIVN